MTRKSFDEIEQAIKRAAEAHEPAFDEASWNKMEVLLDKEKDRKRPFIFWLWWLLPLALGGTMISYYAINKSKKHPIDNSQLNNRPFQKNATTENAGVSNNPDQLTVAESTIETNTAADFTSNAKNSVTIQPGVLQNKTGDIGKEKKSELLSQKSKNNDRVNGKMKSKIFAGETATGENFPKEELGDNRLELKTKVGNKTENEDVVIVAVDGTGADEKTLEKLVDSVISKTVSDRKSKKKIARFYVIVSTGAEASGVKLFSADKITARYGLSAGYQFTKNISVQAGIYSSTKKYKAGPGDYKTKPGSYWNTVQITKIEAQCKVYEIPVSLRYDFKPEKNLNIFAVAGLSSYIMDKEEYYFYYDRYGVPHQAETNYSGNKSLFSVLRLSAGAEKKVSRQFSLFASPGIAIPLAGVGEGAIKLYSVDLNIGLKFTPSRKK